MNLTVRPRRRFYTVMGVAISAIIVVGFSRSYFLRGLFTLPPLTARLHLHGFVLVLWLALFIVQARLIASNRRGVHRTLGVAGVALGVVAVLTTYAAAFESAALARGRGMAVYPNLYNALLLATMFGGFVVAGALLRHRPETHKRLMLLAMIAAVGPGANRAVVLFVGHAVRDFHVLVILVLVSATLLYDWRTRGRPHWALISGGVLLIASQLTRRLVGGSELWTRVGHWLAG
jgi:hypothetical protein